MQQSEFCQKLFSFRKQKHFDEALVAFPLAASDQTSLLAARNKRHSAVMVRLQAFGQFSDRGPVPAGKSLQLQEQLILQGGDPVLLGDFFAEPEKPAKLITKIRECFIVGF